ncbi:MAG: sigma-70 family RNA polymerase sigma factor [Pirellulales bacterium]
MDQRSEELALVGQLATGDPVAWRAFVDRYQRLVLTRIAVTARELQQPLRPADAEDLCAEVFAQLVARDYAALREFQGRSALSTWLCVITRRVTIRRLIGARREPTHPQQATLPPDELANRSPDDPLAALIQGEHQQQLAAALAELPPRHQELLRLIYLDGCSYREISQRLGIPANSIGPTLQRVQQKLRARMQP